MSGIIKMVHSVSDADGPYKTISEVAEYFECSRDTIRRWGKKCGIPNHKMELNDEGTAFCWLYTEEDIQKFSEFSDTFNHKGGRPKAVTEPQK